MSGDLGELLKSHGIRLAPGEIEALLAESIERVLGGAGGGGEPGLPPTEKKRLEEGGFVFEAGAPGADHPAVLGAAEFSALLASALSVNEAAALLGVNPTRIRQRLSVPKRTLYGIKRDREWWLPRFQFAGKRVVPGLAQVIEVLDEGLHPVGVWRWLTTPNEDLREEPSATALTPLEWLATGHAPARVVELASAL